MKSTLTLLTALLLAPLAALHAADTPKARPNIVFILADDWGWGDLACHGSKLVQTPNIDRLAREGADFHQFNTGSPVCSPSRVAFTTGQFPARFGVHEAIGSFAKNREVPQVDWLDPHAITLPGLLQQAGYITGHVGKWHLGSGQAGDAPMPAAYGIGEHGLFAGTSHPQATQIASHHEVYDAAVKFLREHKAQPFYLNVWIHETHLPHMPSEESLKECAHLDEQQRVYSAVVADGDKGIGKVLAALKELGLEDNTLVVFSSDNGPENTSRGKGMRGKGSPDEEDGGSGYGGFYSVGSTGGARGRKRSLYEGGVRLPFIVRWPGHIAPGVVNKATSVAAVDLLPTVCAAANVSLPASFKPDGENMLPALLGKEVTRTQPIFWDWRGRDLPKDCWPRWAVRDGEWKLVSDDATRQELYRSPDDWAEGKNLAKEHPEIVERLSAKLAVWKATLPKEPPPEFISKATPSKKKRGKAKTAE